MKNYINMADIVEPEKLNIIEIYEQEDSFITEVIVRGKILKYNTQSKRQLWQAVGLEHIEPELLDYIDSLPAGSIFYDIGASTGIFSIYARNSGLNVYAFEPEAQNFSLLEKNNYLNFNNSQGSLATFNIALADTVGIGKMYIASYEAAGHMKILDKPKKVMEEQEFQPSYIQNVLRYDLDYFIQKFNMPHPEHLKIDVDGSELLLIEGAKNTLKNSKTRSIFIELVEDCEHSVKIKTILASIQFKEKLKTEVQNYSGLYNYIFEKHDS